MTAVILTIHTLIVIALIGVVLLQRSDGGALGLGGGGGGGGGFMTGRGAANALTRTTSILAAVFFATSLILAVRAGAGEDDDRVIDELTGVNDAPAAAETFQDPGEMSADDLLNALGSESSSEGETAASEAATTEDLLEGLGVDAPTADDAPEEAPTEPQEDETPNE